MQQLAPQAVTPTEEIGCRLTIETLLGQQAAG